MGIDQATIEQMIAAGIDLVAQVDAPWGGETVDLDIEDVEPFIADRAAWYAKGFGATREQYEDWVANQGAAQCGAKTSKGSRCKNWVSGRINLPFADWLKQDGECCHLHGGLSSEEARER